MTTFTQLTARLKNFLRGWLLVLGIKKGLVECATVCIKSEVILTMSDELDNLMDISIEIASNKRMKKDYIKPFKLTFKDKEMEKKVCANS